MIKCIRNNCLHTLYYIMNDQIIYNVLLSNNIKAEFKEELSPKYYDIIDSMDNPSDDRELIKILALRSNIPVMIIYKVIRTRKTYEIAILWNQLPRMVNYTGIGKASIDKAAKWKSRGWINEDKLVEKRELEGTADSAVPSNECVLHVPEGFTGQIQSKSLFIKLDGLVELIPILRVNNYDVMILTEWVKALTYVVREFPRIAYETTVQFNKLNQEKKQVMSITTELFPNVSIEKNSTVYILSSPSHLAMNPPIAKIGCTIDKDRRKKAHDCSLPNGFYIYTEVCYNAKLVEMLVLDILKKRGLLYNPDNIKAREWVYIKDTQQIINFVKQTIKQVNDLYESTDDFPKEIRDVLQPLIEVKHQYPTDLTKFTEELALLLEASTPCSKMVNFNGDKAFASTLYCTKSNKYYYASFDTVYGRNSKPFCPCCTLNTIQEKLQTHGIYLDVNPDFMDKEKIGKYGITPINTKWTWKWNKYIGINLSLQNDAKNKLEFEFSLNPAFSTHNPPPHIFHITQELRRPITKIPQDMITIYKRIIVTPKYLETKAHRTYLRKSFKNDGVPIPEWLK